jgi:hypothetical protein
MTNKRPAKQSLLLMLNDCCEAINALDELHTLTEEIKNMNLEQRDNLALKDTTFFQLLGITRDQFCVRIRCLFDKDKWGDTHSLKKYYQGELIEKIENHPITIAAIKAANKNIAHMDEKYTKWPSIDDILSSELKKWLEEVKIGIMLI